MQLVKRKRNAGEKLPTNRFSFKTKKIENKIEIKVSE
jgi:hypothetical protein